MGLAAPTMLAHGLTPAKAPPADRSPASTCGASSSASPATAPTSPASRPEPSATATSGSSTARRCGAPAPTTPTRHAAGPHRLGRAQAPGHHVLRAADAPTRRRGPAAAPDERSTPRSTRCSSPTRACRRRHARRAPARAGGSRSPRSPTSAGSARAPTAAAAGRTVGRVREAQAEADEYFATYSWYPQRAGRADLVIECRARRGSRRGPARAPEIAAAPPSARRTSWTAARAKRRAARGRPPGAEGSLGKLAGEQRRPGAALAHALIAGPWRCRRARRTRRRSSPKCSCRCLRRRSPAAPTRSSATSSGSGSLGCLVNRALTVTCRSATSPRNTGR